MLQGISSEVCNVCSTSLSAHLHPHTVQPEQHPPSTAPPALLLSHKGQTRHTPLPLSWHLTSPPALLSPVPGASLTIGILHLLQPRGFCTALITAVSKNRSN